VVADPRPLAVMELPGPRREVHPHLAGAPACSTAQPQQPAVPQLEPQQAVASWGMPSDGEHRTHRDLRHVSDAPHLCFRRAPLARSIFRLQARRHRRRADPADAHPLRQREVGE
jgi:hypothetical protein